MKNKKIAITLTTLIGLLTISALVISEKFSQQFDRSGCIQLTDSNGCDSSKRRTENMSSSDATERQQVTSFLRDSVVAKKTDDAYQALTGYGFLNIAPGFWDKGQIIVELDVQNDIIRQATIKSQVISTVK